MHRINLGELEELVLLIVAILDSEAYGVAVREEIIQQTKREVNISAIHSCLRRLEKKASSIHIGVRLLHKGEGGESVCIP